VSYTVGMASPNVSERLLTAEAFFELSDPIEGGKMELVCGKVVTYMPVSGKHGTRALRIGRSLGSFVDAHRLGEVAVEAGFLVRRSPDTVRAPDVSIFSRHSIPDGGVPEEGFVPFPPTLAIEVVSPDDLDREVSAKVDEYLEAGVERVWVVRPRRRTVTVYRRGGTARIVGRDGVLTSEDAGFSAEGFELSVDSLFD
jgi:Uma2 family endonuclease